MVYLMGAPVFWRFLILVRLGPKELIVKSQATIPTMCRTIPSNSPNDQGCLLEIPVLRIRNLERIRFNWHRSGPVGSTAGKGAGS
jgi:hypothetical protein